MGFQYGPAVVVDEGERAGKPIQTSELDEAVPLGAAISIQRIKTRIELYGHINSFLGCFHLISG